MKYIALALVLLCGCPMPAHTTERTQNAIVAATYEEALEVCIQQVGKSKAAQVEKPKIQADYNACAAAADKKFGRKP